MSCETIHKMLSPYLDGKVTGAEMHQIGEHLNGCRNCRRTFVSLRSAQQMTTQLGRKRAPADLELKIRLALSHEASMTLRRRLQGFAVRAENALNSFMVPATAGLVSAVVFFGLLLGFFAMPAQVEAASDPMLPAVYTAPQLDASPFDTTITPGAGSLLVEAVVDANGRVQDYRVISSPSPETERALPQIKNILLFTVFRPATAFGRPTTGRVVLSFSNVINVRG